MTEGKTFWLTLAVCVAVFCAFNPQGFSDTDADQAVAADAAQAPLDAAAQVAFGKHPLAYLEGP